MQFGRCDSGADGEDETRKKSMVQEREKDAVNRGYVDCGVTGEVKPGNFLGPPKARASSQFQLPSAELRARRAVSAAPS